MKEKVGIAVIGTGFARRVQIPVMGSFDDVELVSIASKSLENARSCSEDFGFDHFTNDWKESVTQDGVDLVLVTTPPVFHAEMTRFALENGKHVLCEKPMAMNSVETGEMAEAAEKSGFLAVIDHELRFTAGRMQAYRMIREDRIGKIRHSKYLFRNAARGNPDLPWTWWSSKEMGGGALGAIGSHVIDSFRWFLDTEIESVKCQLNTHIKERPFEEGSRAVSTDDECLMMLRFSDSEVLSGATGLASISLVEGGPYRNRIEFFGSKGAIRVEDDGQILVADNANHDWESVELDLGDVVDSTDTTGWSRGFVTLGRKVIDSIKIGETSFEHAPTFEDGHAIQKVLDECGF